MTEASRRNRSVPAAASAAVLICLVAIAAPPADAFLSARALIGLFVQDGGELSLQPTTYDPAHTKVAMKPAGAAPGCSPVLQGGNGAVNAPGGTVPVCGPVSLGTFTLDRDLRTAGDAALQLWLSTNAPGPLGVVRISATLTRLGAAGGTSALYAFNLGSGSGNAAVSESAVGNPTTIGTTATRFIMGASRSQDLDLTAGDRLRLDLDNVTVAANVPDHVDLFVHFGAKAPSGVVFAVQSNGGGLSGVRLAPNTLGVYLGKNMVSLAEPTPGTDQVFAVGANADPAKPVEIAWGQAVLDEAVHVTGDALASIHARVLYSMASAEPRLNVQVNLYVNNVAYSGTTGTNAQMELAGSAPAPTRFVMTLPTRGIDIPAGAVLKVGIIVTGLTKVSDLDILYGTDLHPSGILLPVEGGGSLPWIAPTPTTTTTSESSPPTTTPTSPTNTTSGPEPSPTETTEDSASEPSPTNTTADTTPPAANETTGSPVGNEQNISKGGAPGFGTLAALIGVSGVLIVLRRRG